MNREQLFALAREATTQLILANAASPYNHHNYDKWEALQSAALGVLVREGFDLYIAREWLCDSNDNIYTLAEFDQDCDGLYNDGDWSLGY